MALRNILPDTNELLHKECKKVTIFDDNLRTLIDDMPIRVLVLLHLKWEY